MRNMIRNISAETVAQLAESHKIVYVVPSFVLISVLTRLFLTHFPWIPFPKQFFLFITGTILSICVCFLLGEDYYDNSMISAQTLFGIYFPIYIYSVIYQTDYYIFVRYLPVAVIITGVMFAGGLILGLTMIYIIHSNWSMVMGFLAGISCLPIYSAHVSAILKDLYKYKHLGTILETEGILIYIPTMISYNILLGNIQGFVVRHYQYVVVLFRFILIGLVVGTIIGKISSLLMCWKYNDAMSVVCISIGMPFLSFIISSTALSGSGCTAVLCSVCMVCKVKHRFTSEVEEVMVIFWRIFSNLMDSALYMFVLTEIVKFLFKTFTMGDFYNASITYLAMNFFRISGYLLVAAVIRCFSYEFNSRCFILLGLCGVKSTGSLICALHLLQLRDTQVQAKSFAADILLCTFLSLVLNAALIRPILKLLGFSELSPSRVANMNNCLNYINEKRNVIINVLKYNRFIANANWAIVRQETILKHPYQDVNTELKHNNELANDIDLPSAISVLTAELSKVTIDMTNKDYAELLKDAKIKVLMAKKMTITKHFENGTINKACAQKLVHMFEMLMDSNSKKSSFSIDKFLIQKDTLLVRVLQFICNRIILDPPQEPMRKCCFYFIMHIAYDYILYAVTVGYVIVALILMKLRKIWIYDLIHCGAFVIYFMDFIGTLYAFNGQAGMKTYFRYIWNCFDFVLLLLHAVLVINILIGFQITNTTNIYIVYILKYVVMVRLLRIFNLFTPIYSKLLKLTEYHIDTTVCFGYDLSMALTYCINDVLVMMPQLIESREIRAIYIKKLLEQKRSLAVSMKQVQRERPWVSITVKTKQAIRTTIRVMMDSLYELKMAGFVDNVEYVFIYNELFEREKYLMKMKFVQPNSPKTLFSEVAWMGNDETFSYLYNRVEKLTWEHGDIVCRQGELVDGIYVVLAGMLKLSYKAPVLAIANYRPNGKIPIIDFITPINISSDSLENIMCGDSFGELSILTGRAYDCNIYSDGITEMFFVPIEFVRMAMNRDADPINGLEGRMWKHATLNLAVGILLDAPMYQSYTQEQMKVKLTDAFVPNMRNYKLFLMTELMVDVILVEGVAADFHKGDVFMAPMLIPRATQKLILPLSGELNVATSADVRLMIIPIIGASAADIIQSQTIFNETSHDLRIGHDARQSLVSAKMPRRSSPSKLIDMLKPDDQRTSVEVSGTDKSTGWLQTQKPKKTNMDEMSPTISRMSSSSHSSTSNETHNRPTRHPSKDGKRYLN